MKMKRQFKRFTGGLEFISVLLTIFLFLFVLAGCASLQRGSIKTYPAAYHTTVKASSETLEQLKIPVTETIADGLKTTLKAQRPDGTPVVVKVERIGRNSTEVSVRAGNAPFGDKRTASQINEIIYERLGLSDKADTKPEFTEENLDDSAHQQITDAADEAWDRSQEKVAAVLSNSAFIIYFSHNSKVLSDKATEKLDRVVEIIRNNPPETITLNGYTDSYGERSYNAMISEMRADMVKAYLVDKGVNSNNIQTFGYGAQKFIGSNKTLEGRRMNRRVEIELSNVKTQ
jgi:outer membrane protein OmpA-like peptidoglycan-associated protein